MTSIFNNLFQVYEPRLINGITKIRKRPTPVGKRGGRVRAFVMTEYYEYYFQTLQKKGKRIPENLFHSSVYNDELMRNVLVIQNVQTKYEIMPTEEIWSQAETRRQIEPYRREYKNQQTNRAINDDDIKLLVAWWWDVELGIVHRIQIYNIFLEPIPFSYDISRAIVMKPKNTRQKRKREEDNDGGRKKCYFSQTNLDLLINTDDIPIGEQIASLLTFAKPPLQEDQISLSSDYAQYFN